jgi:hypothetical protein
MIEDVVINKKSTDLDDPYDYYYNLKLSIPEEINGKNKIFLYRKGKI